MVKLTKRQKRTLKHQEKVSKQIYYSYTEILLRDLRTLRHRNYNFFCKTDAKVVCGIKTPEISDCEQTPLKDGTSMVEEQEVRCEYHDDESDSDNDNVTWASGSEGMPRVEQPSGQNEKNMNLYDGTVPHASTSGENKWVTMSKQPHDKVEKTHSASVKQSIGDDQNPLALGPGERFYRQPPDGVVLPSWELRKSPKPNPGPEGSGLEAKDEAADDNGHTAAAYKKPVSAASATTVSPPNYETMDENGIEKAIYKAAADLKNQIEKNTKVEEECHSARSSTQSDETVPSQEYEDQLGLDDTATPTPDPGTTSVLKGVQASQKPEFFDAWTQTEPEGEDLLPPTGHEERQ